MADPITTYKHQFKFDIDFANASGSTATRSFTIDTKSISGGLSVAQEFQSFLIGQGSTSVAAIVPNQFIQPTGWRDDNPSEPPWTTQKVRLTGITTDETFYGEAGGGSSAGGRSITITGAEDDMDTEVQFTYEGINQAEPPTVSVFYNNQWNAQSLSYYENLNAFYFEKTAVMKNQQGTIYVPPSGTLPAAMEEFTIAY